MKLERTVKVTPESFILSGKISQIVQTAMNFRSVINIIHTDYQMNAKSLIGMMLLKADVGEELIISADGDDAEDAIAVLEKLI